jgi:thioredoxin reductase
VTRDVIIVGGGPAGLTAAATLAQLGVREIAILEREPEAGGVPRHCGHTGFGLRQFHRPLRGPAYARRLVERASAVEILTGVTVTALRPGGALDLATPDGPVRMAGKRVLLALGARETPRSARLVSGTRSWGITTTGALQQMVYLAGLRPFSRAVIVGSELVSFSAILTLRHAGIRPVAMIEEAPRITARRPGDLIARALFGVPVRTGTRLVAILGTDRVEAVEIERDGRRETLACDGVVFTGRFVPEAALLANSHLRVDAGTGGPAIDQHWRCSDPAYFAAGNILRPIESAGFAASEGEFAARAIASSLADRLPAPAREVAVVATAPLRYAYPQRIALPDRETARLMLHARMARCARGELRLLANGREVWSHAGRLMPERRILVPANRLPFADLESIEVAFAETGGGP